jgi:hypothetical protein
MHAQLGFGRLVLGQPELQESIPIGGVHLPRIHLSGQHESALEGSVDAVGPENP